MLRIVILLIPCQTALCEDILANLNLDKLDFSEYETRAEVKKRLVEMGRDSLPGIVQAYNTLKEREPKNFIKRAPFADAISEISDPQRDGEMILAAASKERIRGLQERLFRTLRRSGPGIQFLFSKLQSEDPIVKRTARVGFRFADRQLARKSILDGLGSGSETMKSASIQTWPYFVAQEDLPRLKTIATDTAEKPSHRAAAADCLGRLKSEASRGVIRHLAMSPIAEVRSAAVLQYRLFPRNDDDNQFLIERLDDKSISVRVASLQVLQYRTGLMVYGSLFADDMKTLDAARVSDAIKRWKQDYGRIQKDRERLEKLRKRQR